MSQIRRMTNAQVPMTNQDAEVRTGKSEVPDKGQEAAAALPHSETGPSVCIRVHPWSQFVHR
jgi:hypothetical protein